MVGDLNFNDLYTYDFETVKEMDNIPFLGMSYVLTDKYKVFESSFSEKFKDRPSVMSAFPYDVMTIIKPEYKNTDLIHNLAENLEFIGFFYRYG